MTVIQGLGTVRLGEAGTQSGEEVLGYGLWMEAQSLLWNCQSEPQFSYLSSGPEGLNPSSHLPGSQ